MRGLDTNILVRVFAADDPLQSARASQLLDEGDAGAFFVNVAVLVEFAWTMRRVFKWDESWVRIALNHVVRHPALVIQHRDCVLEAIALTNRAANGFADCLIGALNREAGCETTLTFDRDAAKDRDFQLLPVQKP
jgi:predicted nucleic-acid-binding protein